MLQIYSPSWMTCAHPHLLSTTPSARKPCMRAATDSIVDARVCGRCPLRCSTPSLAHSAKHAGGLPLSMSVTSSLCWSCARRWGAAEAKVLQLSESNAATTLCLISSLVLHAGAGSAVTMPHSRQMPAMCCTAYIDMSQGRRVTDVIGRTPGMMPTLLLLAFTDAGVCCHCSQQGAELWEAYSAVTLGQAAAHPAATSIRHEANLLLTSSCVSR